EAQHADESNSRGRTAAARRERRGGDGDCAFVDVYVFFQRRDEEVGRGKEQGVHLLEGRKSDADGGGREDCDAGGGRGGSGDIVGNGGDLECAAERIEERGRADLLGASVRRNIPAD